jgi:glycosyltransferase involved in cell wall biosynthesis
MKVLIIGKTPPPIGGVTIHVSRLIKSLENNGWSVSYFDYKNINNYKYLFSKKSLVHIHISHKLLRLLFTFYFHLKGNIVINTFHGFYTFNNIYDKLVLFFSKKSIVLNVKTYNNAVKISQKTILIGAFIPPVVVSPLAPDIDEIVNEFRDKYNILFCVNASNYSLNENDEDIYMGKEIVDYFANRYQYGLIFSDPSGYYTTNIYNGEPNILMLNVEHDFVNIIQISDVLIRATLKDGDSISIKEALYFGKVVFATDCVDRPEGVITFNKIEDLDYLIGLSQDNHNRIIVNSYYEIENTYNKVLNLTK